MQKNISDLNFTHNLKSGVFKFKNEINALILSFKSSVHFFQKFHSLHTGLKWRILTLYCFIKILHLHPVCIRPGVNCPTILQYSSRFELNAWIATTRTTRQGGSSIEQKQGRSSYPVIASTGHPSCPVLATSNSSTGPCSMQAREMGVPGRWCGTMQEQSINIISASFLLN